MKIVRTLMVMAAAVVLSSGAAMPAWAAQNPGHCLTAPEVQAAIASGQIKSWPTIKRLAGVAPSYQEVSEVKVCLINGVPFYTVNLVSPNGQATKMVLNAIDGST